MFFIPRVSPIAHHYRLAQLCVAIALIISASLSSLAQSSGSQAAGIENFGKVNENYYRGSQPDADQFAELKRLGVKTIIDLRKDSVDEAPAWVREAGLQYFNIPLTTKTPATAAQAKYFLQLVNNPANWPVYVHCKGGRHRTGEMTAIYRITNDNWTAEQAYDEMKRYDFKNNIFYPRALKKYVFSFYENYRAARDAGAVADTQTGAGRLLPATH